MSGVSEALRTTFRACAAAIGSLLLWTLWLALAIVLAAQIYIASSNELKLPDFVVRQLESRLAASGLRVTFKHTAFDPTGRIFVEDAQISLPEYQEPVLTARAIYVQLDLWSLAIGRFQPREIRLNDATAFVPAMLSPSGRPEPIVQNLDAALTLSSHAIDMIALSARVAGVVVSAHGVLPLPRRAAAGEPSPDVAEFLASHFPPACRQIMAATAKIAALEQPSLEVEFVPSESGAAVANVTIRTRAFKLDQPFALAADDIVARTRVLVLGNSPEVTRLELAIDAIRLPSDARLHGAHVIAFGRLKPDSFEFEPRELIVTAENIEAEGCVAAAVSARLYPRPWPRVDGSLTGDFLGSPLAVRADADFNQRSATVRFEGPISPGILDPLSRRLHVDVREFFDFASLDVANGEVRLGSKWSFEKLLAHVTLRRINAHGVVLDEGRADVELDGHRFHSPDAYARIGPNFARGTYDHDLKTQEYRFVLQGRLRPMDISGWFRDWWPNFFRQFDFPVAPPNASVDVHSSWRDGRQAGVFVFADAPKPVIRNVAFDRVRTRLFVRAGYVDGPEMFATRGDRAATGSFTLTSDPESGDWKKLQVGLDSSFELQTFTTLLGPAATGVLEPFALSAPPQLKLTGQFDGPSSPPPQHRTFNLEAQTRGDFRFYGFPLEDVSFAARVQDDDVTIDRMVARFAGGAATGHAKVWTEGSQRRLGFDYAIKDANLGSVEKTLQEFFAHQSKEPSTKAGKFIQEKANVRFDLAASAEGLYADPYSFHGGGNAALAGAEIGEVPLLGSLSELLKFTALRFTSANANFKINGPRLDFSVIELRGANSAIDAHGSYALDHHALDFNAKIYPFQESGNILKSVVGAVLTPLSNVFEVKLSGSIEKPQWSFVIGPTNFIRALADPNKGAEAKHPAEKEPASEADIKVPSANATPTPASPPKP